MTTIKAKKSLGQNFLSSDKILGQILTAGKLNSADTVLEIGPGPGDLTNKLLGTTEKVIAVEKDDRLISILEQRFSKEIVAEKFQLIHADVLEFEPKEYGLKDYKLIANIPYYLTGAILRKFLETENKPRLIVLTLQKEVVLRIIAEKGSILGMSIRAFGQPSRIGNISKSYFKPVPKVDSAILLIDEISNKFFEKEPKIREEAFFKILKSGFKQKRKKLISNLKDLAQKEKLIEIFKSCGLQENIRAEELSLEDWRKITQALGD
ncbi:MAG: 16S rRNA (adenine(1518)-N(6)/adenine(1519)-N(6))-dimethyltransferase RsmA [Patescibacteria group bacterium]